MFRHNLLTTALIIALPFSLTACSEEEKEPDPRTLTPLVRTITVKYVEEETRSFTGVVAARVESDLGFRISGKVVQRLVDKGQTVKQGQLLMRIDPIDLELAANAQQEAVFAAQAKAKQSAEDEARYRSLLGTGAISVSSYDQFKAAADTAKAELRAAEAQAKVARNAIRYTELIADADGTVVETFVEPGQVVSAGQVVVQIAHSGPREAAVQLPETLRPSLGSLGQATLFGKDNMTSEAKLRQLSDAADSATRTFEARYVLTGALKNAPLGSTVTIKVVNEDPEAKDSLQIPIGALLDSGKGTGVWRVHGKPASVSWSPVTVLALSDDSARVTGKIKQGDQIVALGAQLLHEGEKVRVSAATSNLAVKGASL